MTGLLDHLKKVREEKEQAAPASRGWWDRSNPVPSKQPGPEPVGPFVWTEDDGTEIEYDYSDKVIMRRGDERMDDDGKVYFVPLEHLPEFDYHDETIQDNEKFWDWFAAFIKRNDLKVTRQKKQRTQVKASDWGFGGETKKKYLSDWWGGGTYFADYKNDDAKRLAVALQAVRSTVRVVDSHTRRLTVELADTDMQHRRDAGEDFSPTSVTDFTNRRLFVSACALVDKKMDQGEAIDITTGFALHEASHGEYTEDVFPAIDQPTRLMPLQLSGFLLNVIEDCRIEGLTSDKFPGFAGYFDKTNEYMWEQFVKEHAPDAWGPDLLAKMNSIVAIAKWPTQYEDIARADAILSDEFDWWGGWRDDYINGRVKARASLVAAIERLKEDPQTREEIEEMTKQEIQAGLDQKALEEALAEALKNNPGLLKPCSSVTQGGHLPGLDVPMDPETNQRAKKLADEELQEDRVIKQQFPHGEGAPGDIVVLKPQEDPHSHDQYQPPNQGLVQRMKSSFLMRPSAMEWTDRLQKGGAVDEDEIWRAGAGDMRFFERRVVESAPDTSVALLVDMSGSMNGRKLRAASDAASIIHACTKDMRGVRVRVYGHTGDQLDSGDGNSMVYRIWEQGDPVSRLGTLMTQPKGDNYDGYALGWVVQDLLKHSTPEEQTVVFIISDGLPNGWGNGGHGFSGGYGGEGAMDHIRGVVRWAERQGVDVIQIAIDPHMRPEEQARMYKNWIPFEDISALPGQVMGALKKLM